MDDPLRVGKAGEGLEGGGGAASRLPVSASREGGGEGRTNDFRARKDSRIAREASASSVAEVVSGGGRNDETMMPCLTTCRWG